MAGAGVALIGLLLVNLAGAVFCSGKRMFHLLLAIFAALAFVGGITMSSLIGNAQARWFLKSGVHEYDQMVAKVIHEKSLLTSKVCPLDSIVGRSGVWGQTNEDGSVLITFAGIGTYMRSYRLYYSGNRMETRPDDTNIFYFPELPSNLYVRITNNWYVHLKD